MKLNVYTIFDSAAQVFMHPIFQQADGQAVRTFSDLAVNAEHPVGQHPEHYSLFRIGSFNDNNGEILPEPAIEKLITGIEAVKASQQVDRERIQQLEQSINGEKDNAKVGNGAQLQSGSQS